MENPNPEYPAWCPSCGTPQGLSYPYLIGTTVVGCKECQSVWTPEDLKAMVVNREPGKEATNAGS